jgi:hypothetical protein
MLMPLNDSDEDVDCTDYEHEMVGSAKDRDTVLRVLTAYRDMGERVFARDLNSARLQEDPHESENCKHVRVDLIKFITECMTVYAGYRSKLIDAINEINADPENEPNNFAQYLFEEYLDGDSFFEHYGEEWEHGFAYLGKWPAPEPLAYWDPLHVGDDVHSEAGSWTHARDTDYKEHLRGCFKPSPWALEAAKHAYDQKYADQIRARHARVNQSAWAAQLDRHQTQFMEQRERIALEQYWRTQDGSDS